MTAFVTAVTEAISIDVIMGYITPLLPIILVALGVSITLGVFKRSIKGLAKGKVRL